MTETHGSAGPVMVVIVRLVKPGREREYEAWLAGIANQMSKFDGFRGFELARPVDGLQPEHVVILRFDSLEHLKAWEVSATRRTWLAKADSLTDQLISVQHISGLEGLFALGAANLALAPPKYKMLVVVSAGLYPLVVLANLFVAPLLPLPLLGRMLVTTVLNVALMTYLVMPQLTRLLRSWLAVRPAQSPAR